MFRRLGRRLRILRFRLQVRVARRPVPRALLRNFAFFYLGIALIAASVVGITLYPGVIEMAAGKAAQAAKDVVRGGAQTVPLLINWIQPRDQVNANVIKETMPRIEIGPESESDVSIATTVRGAVEFLTGYDFDDPRSFFVVEAGGRHLDVASQRLITRPMSLARVPDPTPQVIVRPPTTEVPETPSVSQPTPLPTQRPQQPEQAIRPAETVPGPEQATPNIDRQPDQDAVTPAERLEQAAAEAVPVKKDWGDKPLVLIYHHHSTEAYGLPGDSHVIPSDNSDETVVQVGERLAVKLEELGIPAVHWKKVFDYPRFSFAYINGEKPLEQMIKDNPQLLMVLDIHRDSGSVRSTLQTQTAATGDRLVGKEIAQVAVVAATNGSKAYPHPNWRANYEFGIFFDAKIRELAPELAAGDGVLKKVNKRYNQHVHPHALILEVGGHQDTIEQALRSADLLAEVIVSVLDEMTQQQ